MGLLDGFQEVTTANPVKKANYDIKVSDKTGRFKLSNDLFDRYNLLNSSLKEYAKINPETGEAVDVKLAIMPGNEGNFYKRKGISKKGKAFKNVNLLKHLREIGITGDKLGWKVYGEENGVIVVEFYDTETDQEEGKPADVSSEMEEQERVDTEYEEASLAEAESGDDDSDEGSF